FIHTATLLHDDVVDESSMRRGRQTANALFGNAASVLVGDFLYSRSFQMMVALDDMRVMRILSDATNVIAEGEVLQLLNMHDPDVTEDSYLKVIRSKTAKLFEAAAELGALVGDYLYSRAFEMMTSLDNMRIMEILSRATTVIAEGEVLQLLNMHDPDVTQDSYLTVIRSKTAKLFEAAAQLGALIAGANDAQIEAAGEYGRSLGTAFQLIDDVLDYAGDAAEIGKNVGDDLREGKPTLPLIYVMENGTAEQRELIRSCIEQGDETHFDAVLAAVSSSGALDYTRREAEAAARRAAGAIADLPDSEYKSSLLQLCSFAVDRNH
ncbi:MAG: polyprenyl synthetase family protein, partial [Telluria sp.]